MPITSISVWVVLLAMAIPSLFVTDSWLSFADGRQIAQHWIPRVDTLTVWMDGRHWTDQQWAAHLTLYELATHGSLAAAAAAAIGSVAAALAVCAIAARLLGGSSRSTAIALLPPVLAAPWMAEVRPQTFALVPFAAVYALLAQDSRRPSRHVFWVVPLLVVWANVHGSVVLAAGVVAAYGLARTLRADTRVRGASLAALAPLCVLISPYGLQLVDYYRLMLINPPLARWVVEWQPASFGRLSASFFISGFVAAGLWGSQRHRLTAFERWALPLLLLASLNALRNAIWFELALAMALPRLLDGVWPSRIVLSPRIRQFNVRLGGGALAVALVIAAVQIGRAPGQIERRNQPAEAALVATAAGANGLVLADDVHADWLLWREPALAGRIAYDVRFELLTAGELTRLHRLHEPMSAIWRRCAVGFAVVTFPSRSSYDAAVREQVLRPRSRTIVNTPSFVAVAQPASTQTPCRL